MLLLVVALLKNAKNERRKSSKSSVSNIVKTRATTSRSFKCSTELLTSFERRASDLGCSFDWLLEEAMQRLLAEDGVARFPHEAPDAPPESERPSLAPPTSAHRRTPRTLPPPPDALPKTMPAPPLPPRVERTHPSSDPTPVDLAPMTERQPDTEAELRALVLSSDGEQFVIDRQPFIVGRSASTCQLVIDDALVSRRHAAFERLPQGWAVNDLGSTNGIIVDGVAVRHAFLRPGMMLSIGPMTFGVIST